MQFSQFLHFNVRLGDNIRALFQFIGQLPDDRRIVFVPDLVLQTGPKSIATVRIWISTGYFPSL